MPGPPKRYHGLRHVELDNDAPAEPMRSDVRNRLKLRFGGEPAEHVIEHRLHCLGIDVAHHGDFQVAARRTLAGYSL